MNAARNLKGENSAAPNSPFTRTQYLTVLMLKADLAPADSHPNQETAGQWVARISPFVKAINSSAKAAERAFRMTEITLAQIPDIDSRRPAFHLGLAEVNGGDFIAVVFSGRNIKLTDKTVLDAQKFAQRVFADLETDDMELFELTL